MRQFERRCMESRAVFGISKMSLFYNWDISRWKKYEEKKPDLTWSCVIFVVMPQVFSIVLFCDMFFCLSKIKHAFATTKQQTQDPAVFFPSTRTSVFVETSPRCGALTSTPQQFVDPGSFVAAVPGFSRLDHVWQKYALLFLDKKNMESRRRTANLRSLQG